MTQARGNGTVGTIGVIALLVGLAWLCAVFVLPKYKMDYATKEFIVTH